MESVEQLTQKAKGLQPVDRIKLVEAILRSLDKPDPEIEKIWVTESEARYDAYNKGEVGSTDWEDIKKRHDR